LVERLHGMQEVIGSNPLSSTEDNNALRIHCRINFTEKNIVRFLYGHKMILGWLILISTVFISCYRDNQCECFKKKGCKTLYVFHYNPTYVAERLKYCPSIDYDNDPGFTQYLSDLKKKYDSIQKSRGVKYSITIIDSFRYDTTRGVLGKDVTDYSKKGFFCRCHD
jgi:hypothetical protein